jgi:hypothetical protein
MGVVGGTWRMSMYERAVVALNQCVALRRAKVIRHQMPNQLYETNR